MMQQSVSGRQQATGRWISRFCRYFMIVEDVYVCMLYIRMYALWACLVVMAVVVLLTVSCISEFQTSANSAKRTYLTGQQSIQGVTPVLLNTMLVKKKCFRYETAQLLYMYHLKIENDMWLTWAEPTVRKESVFWGANTVYSAALFWSRVRQNGRDWQRS